MPIIKNGKNISAIYKGNIPISKIYKGANVVWEVFKTLMLSGTLPLSFTGIGKPLIDYKIYGNSVSELLPPEYQQVEYIEATGEQYFELNYIPNNKTNSRGKFQVTDTAIASILFGARQKSSSNNFYGFNWGGDSPFKWVNSYYTGQATEVRIDNKIHTFDKKAGVLKLDGNEIGNYVPTVTNWNTTYKMIVFGCNTAGAVGLNPKARIFDLAFDEGEGDLFNLIACYRKSDGEIGMYDTVNKVFHTNQGTGEFLKGNDIIANPTPENPIKFKNVGDKTKNLCELGTTTFTQYKSYKLANPIPAGTYTVSASAISNDTDGGATCSMLLYDVNGNQVTGLYVLKDGTRGKKTFTANSAIRTINLYASDSWSNGAGDVVTWSDIQIEEGSTATKYEPYGYKIPIEITNYGTYPIYANEQLAKIGEYSDFVDFENQNITRAVGVYTFDGTENWEAHKENDDNVVYRLDNVLTPLLNAPTSATYMTHFALTNIYSTAEFTSGLYRFSLNQDDLTIASSRLYVSSDKMTVAEFKAWLAENKPTIYYPIAPTEETIELPEIPTFKGENILDINTEIKPSNVEITYKGK